MYIKIHKSYRTVVAICDSNLLGKKFEEGIKQLDIQENFFKGTDLPEQEVIKIIQQQGKEDATFNIVGNDSIEAALKAEIISEDSIGKIQEIPYALKLL
ncbi:MAG: DUF424 family protein [Nanoarchaeota archaeon]